MNASAALLLLAFFATAASAQTAPGVLPAPVDGDLQAARATTCVVFLKQVAQHRSSGGASDTTPSFMRIWGALLKADKASGEYMGKNVLNRIMFVNTERACQRMRGRTLGATMDAEYAAL